MKWIYLISVFAVLMLVMGVDECPTGTGGQSQSGLTTSLVSGVGYFKQGMQINLGDTFRVVLSLSNYDNTEKKGSICVKDNQGDIYGGITGSGDCQQYTIPAASFNNGQLLNPSTQTIAFPSNGEYTYTGIPISTSVPAKLFVSYSYVQNSVAQAIANVPTPDQETLSMQQPSAPITVSVDKTVSTQQNQYKLNLGINIQYQASSNIKIYGEDLRTENATRITVRLSPREGFSGYTLDCNPIQGIINIASTKFIKCSALIPAETAGYPLLINTDYGVMVTDTFDFNINKEA